MSLRDVERAMIVFEYFYDKMKVFGPRMDEIAATHQKKVSLQIVVSLSICWSV